MESIFSLIESVHKERSKGNLSKAKESSNAIIEVKRITFIENPRYKIPEVKINSFGGQNISFKRNIPKFEYKILDHMDLLDRQF